MTGAVGAASNITESRTQAELLEHARTVMETCVALVGAAKSSAGNPRVSHQSLLCYGNVINNMFPLFYFIKSLEMFRNL